MLILVEWPTNQQSIPIRVHSPFATVSSIKTLINKLTGLSVAQQRIFYRGFELENKHRLADFDVTSGATLLLALRRPITGTPNIGLEPYGPSQWPDRLGELLEKSRASLFAGKTPRLAGEGEGGTYFLKDLKDKYIACFKPQDEEPFAPNNPKKFCGELGQVSLRQGVLSGEAYEREVAAYLLDHDGVAGVPQTALVEAWHPAFNNSGTVLGDQGEQGVSPDQIRVKRKIGSFQEFVEYDSMAGDWSCSKFPVGEVQKIALLDIRIFNVDRNDANILVKWVSREDAPSTATYGTTESRVPLLIPIDHGYCMPDNFEVGWVDWVWAGWPQIKQPLLPELKRYILGIDIDSDIQRLRSVLTIREECLAVLRVTGHVLQAGVRAGMTLYDIANVIARTDLNAPAPLEDLVKHAGVIAHSLQHKNGHHSVAPVRPTALLRAVSRSSRVSNDETTSVARKDDTFSNERNVSALDAFDSMKNSDNEILLGTGTCLNGCQVETSALIQAASTAIPTVDDPTSKSCDLSHTAISMGQSLAASCQIEPVTPSQSHSSESMVFSAQSNDRRLSATTEDSINDDDPQAKHPAASSLKGLPPTPAMRPAPIRVLSAPLANCSDDVHAPPPLPPSPTASQTDHTNSPGSVTTDTYASASMKQSKTFDVISTRETASTIPEDASETSFALSNSVVSLTPQPKRVRGRRKHLRKKRRRAKHAVSFSTFRKMTVTDRASLLLEPKSSLCLPPSTLAALAAAAAKSAVRSAAAVPGRQSARIVVQNMVRASRLVGVSDRLHDSGLILCFGIAVSSDSHLLFPLGAASPPSALPWLAHNTSTFSSDGGDTTPISTHSSDTEEKENSDKFARPAGAVTAVSVAAVWGGHLTCSVVTPHGRDVVFLTEEETENALGQAAAASLSAAASAKFYQSEATVLGLIPPSPHCPLVYLTDSDRSASTMLSSSSLSRTAVDVPEKTRSSERRSGQMLGSMDGTDCFDGRPLMRLLLSGIQEYTGANVIPSESHFYSFLQAANDAASSRGASYDWSPEVQVNVHSSEKPTTADPSQHVVDAPYDGSDSHSVSTAGHGDTCAESLSSLGSPHLVSKKMGIRAANLAMSAPLNPRISNEDIIPPLQLCGAAARGSLTLSSTRDRYGDAPTKDSANLRSSPAFTPQANPDVPHTVLRQMNRCKSWQKRFNRQRSYSYHISGSSDKLMGSAPSENKKTETIDPNQSKISVNARCHLASSDSDEEQTSARKHRRSRVRRSTLGRRAKAAIQSFPKSTLTLPKTGQTSFARCYDDELPTAHTPYQSSSTIIGIDNRGDLANVISDEIHQVEKAHSTKRGKTKRGLRRNDAFKPQQVSPISDDRHKSNFVSSDELPSQPIRLPSNDAQTNLRRSSSVVGESGHRFARYSGLSRAVLARHRTYQKQNSGGVMSTELDTINIPPTVISDTFSSYTQDEVNVGANVSDELSTVSNLDSTSTTSATLASYLTPPLGISSTSCDATSQSATFSVGIVPISGEGLSQSLTHISASGTSTNTHTSMTNDAVPIAEFNSSLPPITVVVTVLGPVAARPASAKNDTVALLAAARLGRRTGGEALHEAGASLYIRAPTDMLQQPKMTADLHRIGSSMELSSATPNWDHSSSPQFDTVLEADMDAHALASEFASAVILGSAQTLDTSESDMDRSPVPSQHSQSSRPTVPINSSPLKKAPWRPSWMREGRSAPLVEKAPPTTDDELDEAPKTSDTLDTIAPVKSDFTLLKRAKQPWRPRSRREHIPPTELSADTAATNAVADHSISIPSSKEERASPGPLSPDSLPPVAVDRSFNASKMRMGGMMRISSTLGPVNRNESLTLSRPRTPHSRLEAQREDSCSPSPTALWLATQSHHSSPMTPNPPLLDWSQSIGHISRKDATNNNKGDTAAHGMLSCECVGRSQSADVNPPRIQEQESGTRPNIPMQSKHPTRCKTSGRKLPFKNTSLSRAASYSTGLFRNATVAEGYHNKETSKEYMVQLKHANPTRSDSGTNASLQFGVSSKFFGTENAKLVNRQASLNNSVSANTPQQILGSLLSSPRSSGDARSADDASPESHETLRFYHAVSDLEDGPPSSITRSTNRAQHLDASSTKPGSSNVNTGNGSHNASTLFDKPSQGRGTATRSPQYKSLSGPATGALAADNPIFFDCFEKQLDIFLKKIRNKRIAEATRINTSVSSTTHEFPASNQDKDEIHYAQHSVGTRNTFDGECSHVSQDITQTQTASTSSTLTSRQHERSNSIAHEEALAQGLVVDPNRFEDRDIFLDCEEDTK